MRTFISTVLCGALLIAQMRIAIWLQSHVIAGVFGVVSSLLVFWLIFFQNLKWSGKEQLFGTIAATAVMIVFYRLVISSPVLTYLLVWLASFTVATIVEGLVAYRFEVRRHERTH